MNRDKTIDNLRGLAMFAMIVIHAASYYLRNKTTLLIWDNLQWAVPVFFFSSFYLFFLKTKEIKKEYLIPFFKKRLTRLLLPYYVFLAAYFFLAFFFDKNHFNSNFFLANFFLYGGSFNWLVLVFVYFTFLMPVIWYLKRHKIIYWGIFALSVASSFYFIFAKPIPFRVILWLPWLSYMFFTTFFIENANKTKKLFLTAILSLVLFFILRQVEINIGHNLTHYENKYPPTLYHLSFGVFWVIILHWLSEKNVFAVFKFDRLLYFLSINSYPLYFIHILVIYMIRWLHLSPPYWPIFFVEIFGLSCLIRILYLRLGRAFVRGR